MSLTAMWMERLALASPEKRTQLLGKLSAREALRFDGWFEAWADASQLPPETEGWRTWLMMGGRGFGKTRAGAEWILSVAGARKRQRIALVAASIEEARSVMVEGRSGLLAVARSRDVTLRWERTSGTLRWPCGSVAQIFSGESPDGLRGPEHHFAWLLTFEILAGEGLTIGSLLAEASGGLIEAQADRAIEGYAVHGQSVGDALHPVFELLDQPLRSQGNCLLLGDGRSVDIETHKLEATLDETRTHRIEKVRADAEMPSVLQLDYYDASLDYQAGRSMARAFGGRRDVTIDAPMVLSALDARHWAEETLRKQWQTRRTIEIDILPSAMTVQPGDEVRLGADTSRWQVTSVELDRFAVKMTARWIGERVDTGDLPVDAGQNVGAPDIVRAPTQIALFEPPDLDGSGSGQLLLAAANASPGWVATPIELSVGSQWDMIQSAGRESVWGKCETILPAATTAFIDARSTVIVELVDPDANLVSVSDEALLAGSNLAMIGAELLQFGRAKALGGGRFALSRFLRGRRGCEVEVARHEEREDFVLMDAARLVSIAVESERVGTWVRANPAGLADDDAQEHGVTFKGTASRPLSPVHLSSQEQGGELSLNWTRRDRNGFGWMDDVDAPLSEGREAYRVKIRGQAGELVEEIGTSAIQLDASQLTTVGAKPWAVSVVMIGDKALSHAAQMTIE
ncbi:phage tail protein [Sphingomicrobium sp. XHP0235]|uniref:GTA baseplate fiber-binding domain-containing protein n=1 Tax=Sphingomicrobium aquimarinum TaxID=3133971 RepID=UPI0031FEA3D6